ncbi:MAG: peptidase dimerization domain-containing protein [Pseudomonadota bacterium]
MSRQAKGDAMICGDVGSPSVVRFGEKGLCWIEIDAVGLPAHGAHVHKGRNAIDRLRGALDGLKRLEDLPGRRPAARDRGDPGGEAGFGGAVGAGGGRNAAAADGQYRHHRGRACRPISCRRARAPRPTFACRSASRSRPLRRRCIASWMGARASRGAWFDNTRELHAARP